MKWQRKSRFFLVYVRASDLKFPIVIPIPLAALEEVLRGLTILAWLGQGGLNAWSRSRRRPVSTFGQVYAGTVGSGKGWKEMASSSEIHTWAIDSLRRVRPWRLIAAVQKAVEDMRRFGPFDLVSVDAPDAKVRISLK